MISKWFCLTPSHMIESMCLLFFHYAVTTIFALSDRLFSVVMPQIPQKETYLRWTQNIPLRAGLKLFTQEGFSSPLQQEKLLSVECEHFSQLNNCFLCLDLFPLSIALFAARVLSFTWPQKQIGPNNSSVYSLRSLGLWLLSVCQDKANSRI